MTCNVIDGDAESYPDLVDESSDEEPQHGENHSECSSADLGNVFEFLRSHYEEGVSPASSDAESAEDKPITTNTTEPGH